MFDIQGAISLVFEFLWTLIKVNYETIRGMWRVLVPPEPKEVKDDIIFITGTGHGIGREVALRFAKLGGTIVCVDINASSNEETVKLIKQEKGKAHSYQCDVTDRAAVMQLAERVCREVGDVSILINNAGIMPCKPVLKQTEQEIKLMNDININANLWTIQAFLPSMIARNHGHIVAMSSMAGLMGLTNLVPYCGSKYAVRGIMEALAVELSDDPRKLNGIKLTTICPYIVDTGLCKKPRIRFQNLMKVVTAGEAADMIVDAVRREIVEITLPYELHYLNRYIYRLLPFPAARAWNAFFNTGVDSHE
ncbi:epidermal retinol dehydrogenase 2-like isoform X2 [Vanessa atalanta]|uniref:epidermal retinol dehydrogenase 2-like isoform X1 n=1 Tax=Vanessa atalanta TaxID=42275 RepID=UPI001FCD3063|nr:epidermal retinol dehydrogenase 2-like isoform X1 [Vanessa atalanta]XP_047527819.1 epidermal retinol dehydrogenase 2-like isoform X2 [Vanessa atalanta]